MWNPQTNNTPVRHLSPSKISQDLFIVPYRARIDYVKRPTRLTVA